MGDHPVLDEEAKGMVGRLAEGWIDGPIRYISRDEGDVLMAVGSVNGNLRREVLVEYPPRRPGVSGAGAGVNKEKETQAQLNKEEE